MRRLAGVLIIAFSLAACGIDDPILPADELLWHAFLQPEPSWEHLTGEAALGWVEGSPGFNAAALVLGDQPGAERQWRLHVGTCAGGGALLGSETDYPALLVGPDGSAFAATSLLLPIEPTGTYHVRIHRAEDRLDEVIACGDLELQ